MQNPKTKGKKWKKNGEIIKKGKKERKTKHKKITINKKTYVRKATVLSFFYYSIGIFFFIYI
jgi:hypothetical protein